VGRVATTVHSDKHQARPPTDHFKKLLEDAYPNHAYPIRHKLQDCDMMKSPMISRSPTRGAELDEDPGGSNTVPFPGENTVITVYGGRRPRGTDRVSKLSPEPLTHYGWGARRCKGTNFLIHIYMSVCVCVRERICTLQPLQKMKTREKDGGVDSPM
jgi:hypothetical protein